MIFDPWLFVLVALGAFRVTRFVVWDVLAGASLESESEWSKVLHDWCRTDQDYDRSLVHGKVYDLLTCPWCIGFWVTVLVVCVVGRVWPWMLGVEGWLTVWAAAGAAGLLNRVDRWNS